MADEQTRDQSLTDPLAPSAKAMSNLTDTQIKIALQAIEERLATLEQEITELRADRASRDADTPADTFEAMDEL